MTREEIYQTCVQKIAKTNCLLLETATGTGKTSVSINLSNHLISMEPHRPVSILILVAKRVHKQTWNEEIMKWGGIKAGTIRMECYESLHKCLDEYYDIIIADEVHHIGSDQRLELMKGLRFSWFIGLSATIPRKLKMCFKYRYHAEVVSCDIIEAIEDDILPEPTILLFPLLLDNRQPTEQWELNAKLGGNPVRGEYKDLWKLKKQKVHAVISMTQKQKLMEYDKLIEWEKNKYMQTRHEGIKQSWLFHSGKRLEFLSYCKNQIVSDILKKLQKERTITFCKTIEQSELLGKYCIHSQNTKSDSIYERFNQKRINHITTVNILNENANLVDCKYAVFANCSSSEVVQVQRTGRALRHKHPVIIIPYYQGTREEEIVKKQLEDFNKDFIKVIHSIQEI